MLNGRKKVELAKRKKSRQKKRARSPQGQKVALLGKSCERFWWDESVKVVATWRKLTTGRTGGKGIKKREEKL